MTKWRQNDRRGVGIFIGRQTLIACIEEWPKSDGDSYLKKCRIGGMWGFDIEERSQNLHESRSPPPLNAFGSILSSMQGYTPLSYSQSSR